MSTKEKKRKPTPPRTLESWMIVNGQDGEVFYTNKSDSQMTGLASHYNRLIRVEKGVYLPSKALINDHEVLSSKLIKVTLLSFKS